MPSDDVIQPGKTPSSSDMFTPAEYRKRYDCADVSRYLKQGRVRGAVPTEDGSFLIPMGALIEYRPTGKQPSFDIRTIKDDMWDILRSCSLKMSYIDATVLKTTQSQFSHTVDLLVECGYLSRSPTPSDGVTCTSLQITPKGIQMLDSVKDKQGWRKLYQTTISAIVEGQTKALLNIGE